MKEKEYLTLNVDSISPKDCHHYLLSAVAPRPIALASTISKDGMVNLSPFSYFNVFSSNPPVLVFSPTLRGRDSTTKDTHDNILEVPEVVINIVNHGIVEQMSLSSSTYAKGVNEFKKSGLTEIASDLIKPPRVAESPVSLECKIQNVIPLGDTGGAGNLVICKVVMIHLDTSILDSQQRIDTEKIDLVARMGGMWYTRAHQQALFQIPKPLRHPGIGVDALPSHVLTSHILTGNDIGRLGGSPCPPSDASIQQAKLKLMNISDLTMGRLHLEVQQLIEKNEVEQALSLLYAYSM